MHDMSTHLSLEPARSKTATKGSLRERYGRILGSVTGALRERYGPLQGVTGALRGVTGALRGVTGRYGRALRERYGSVTGAGSETQYF